MAEAPHVAVLAAGGATRFGGGKLDALCAGKPLGRRVLDAVASAGLAPGSLVVGPDAPGFAANAEGWELLVNPAPEQGLGTSLAIAAGRAMERGDPALLVLLADMPLVTSALIGKLAAAQTPAAVHHADGRPGVPALFPAALLPKLARLTGDRGAGPLLASLDSVALIEAPPGTLLDVDTPEDLARAEAALAS